MRRALAAGLAALSLVAADHAAASTGALDLGTDAITAFTAVRPDFDVGASVAGAGDVNGDGRPDLLIGAPGSQNNDRTGSGSVYVVFGAPAFAATTPLAGLGAGGFRIDGARAEDAGYEVAAVGDANGDGLGDIAVGAPGASNNGRRESGSVYVVHGKRDGAPVDLAALGAGGYRIDGATPGAVAGVTVAGTGDVNGDGRGDVLVGSAPREFGGEGDAYVVFGRRGGRGVDLARLGTAGITLRGGRRVSGPWVAALGDVNADGRGDLIVGTPTLRAAGTGAAFVVYGRPEPGDLRLTDVAAGAGGYPIRIRGWGDGNVSGPGDVNGDGRPDVLIRDGSVAHVVFSEASGGALRLADVGERTLSVRVPGAGALASGSGDANGDGLADLIVGTRLETPRCHEGAGSAHVVFGRAAAGAVDAGDAGAGGYRIDGAARADGAGASVAWAGDVDRDGRSDMLIGAPQGIVGTFDLSRPARSGATFLVAGRSAPVAPPPATPDCLAVALPAQRLSQVVRRGALRATVAFRSTDEVFLTARVSGHGAVARGYVVFDEPGERGVELALTRRGRRLVASRRRLRVRVVVETGLIAPRKATATAVLER